MAKLDFLTSPVPPSALPAWGTEISGQQLNLVGLGLKTLIPAPPAGFVRFCSKEAGEEAKYPIGVEGYPTDGGGVLPGGTFDGQYRIGGNDFRAPAAGAISLGDADPFCYLVAGEAFEVDVTALGGGATGILGRVTWQDFPDTGVTTIRTTIPDTNPINLIPPVPVGMASLGFAEPGMVEDTGLVIVDNRDSIPHDFNVYAVFGGQRKLIAVLTVGPGSIDGTNNHLIKQRVLEGDSIEIVMQEAVGTVAPRLYWAYKTLPA